MCWVPQLSLASLLAGRSNRQFRYGDFLMPYSLGEKSIEDLVPPACYFGALTPLGQEKNPTK